MSPPPTVNEASLATDVRSAPITCERKLNLDLQDQIPKPYLPRAVAAVDPSHPNGTEGKDHHNLSVLQQHVTFFDRNKDGIIYPWETYQGFRAIGCGILPSLVASFLVNFIFGYSTQPGWLPSPLLPIYVKNIHKCMHGSDSKTFDTEGRFDPAKFDAVFSKYAVTFGDALTGEEVCEMLRANSGFIDLIGRMIAFTEWQLLYTLAKDERGLLHREAVRGVFDGSLFEHLEKKNKETESLYK